MQIKKNPAQRRGSSKMLFDGSNSNSTINQNRNTPESARGRWREILSAFGVVDSYLTGKHGPCPICQAGKDRWRWDDKDGRGTYICAQCGAGDGFRLLQSVYGWDFKTAATKIDEFLNIGRLGVDTSAQIIVDRRTAAESEQKRQDEKLAAQAKAATQAAAEIKQYGLANDSHPYLVEKQVKSHGLYLKGNDLLIPIRSATDVIQSYQLIKPDGAKWFLPNGRVKGCFHLIGAPDKTIVICEGYATGASLYEATGYSIACAFNAGNLEPVSVALRSMYRNARIIIGADNDLHLEDNVGVEKATQAAQEVGGYVAVPFLDFDPKQPCDFNDLIRRQGKSQVVEALR